MNQPISSLPTIRIAVTCVGGRLIFDTLHALRQAGDFTPWLLGLDADLEAAGRLLCDSFHRVPHAGEDPDGWLKQVLPLLQAAQIDVFIALSDAESRIVATHRQAFLAAGIRPSVSQETAVLAMTDKYLLLRTLEEHGLDVGPYRLVESLADFRRGLTDLGYPARRVVLKPRGAAGSRGVIIVDASVPDWHALLPDRFCGTADVMAVERKMAEMGVSFENLLLVPLYDGPVFDLDCIARGGIASDICARMRQLRNPLSPTSTGHRIVQHPDVLDYARRITAALNIEGAADYDIVLADGTTPRVFDAGARFSGSVGGSVNAGANFPAQLVRSLMGWPLKPLNPRDGTAIRPFITMGTIPDCNAETLL